jgi:hypothetical protein
MIGAVDWRRTGIALLVALAIGIGFGQRSADAARADPPGEKARIDAMASAARDADRALARLSAMLRRAGGHARRGTALTVSGEAPAPQLTAAADVLTSGAAEADAARGAQVELAGIAAAVQPRASVPVLSYGGADLELTAGQLRASAVAATLFVERRHAVQAVIDSLAAGLAALDRNDPAAALDSLAKADAPLTLLGDWVERPPLFRYWMMISIDLVEAARGIASATLDDDPAAVKAAAERYAKAADAARGADNALAVTLSQEGSAVSETPLRRLAAAADEVTDARSAVKLLLSPLS